MFWTGNLKQQILQIICMLLVFRCATFVAVWATKIETNLGIVCGLSEKTVRIAHCVPSTQTPLLIEPVSSLLNPKGWGWECTGEGKIFTSFKHSAMESESGQVEVRCANFKLV